VGVRFHLRIRPYDLDLIRLAIPKPDFCEPRPLNLKRLPALRIESAALEGALALAFLGKEVNDDFLSGFMVEDAQVLSDV